MGRSFDAQKKLFVSERAVSSRKTMLTWGWLENLASSTGVPMLHIPTINGKTTGLHQKGAEGQGEEIHDCGKVCLCPVCRPGADSGAK